jgi:hypothetical protein
MRYSKLTPEQRAEAEAAAQVLDVALAEQGATSYPVPDDPPAGYSGYALGFALTQYVPLFVRLLNAEMLALDMRADHALGDLIPNDRERAACIEDMAPMRRLREQERAFARHAQRGGSANPESAQLIADFLRELVKPIMTPAGPQQP